jgi:hypothetical protein
MTWFKPKLQEMESPEGLPKDKDGFYIDGADIYELANPLKDYVWEYMGYGIYMGTAMMTGGARLTIGG